MHTFLCVTALFVATQVSADLKDRDRHPLAPSLPRLTKEESQKIDAIIYRFIQWDIGKLKGDAGKKAVEDFNRLGPESIFNLIDGLNRAANMESSCPAVLIAKRVNSILSSTEDLQLLKFAQQNIGADVTAKRHLEVIKDLQFSVLLRKGALQRRALAKGSPAGGGVRSPSAMSLAELEQAMSKERGPQLKALLVETEKRDGKKAIDLLIKGSANSDPDISTLSQGLLAKNLQHQGSDVLKTLLKHDRRDVRMAAAKEIGAKKLPFGKELIALLQEGDDDVRQAGRRALVEIAGGADYGPNADAGFDERQAALARWREWASKQK